MVEHPSINGAGAAGAEVGGDAGFLDLDDGGGAVRVALHLRDLTHDHIARVGMTGHKRQVCALLPGSGRGGADPLLGEVRCDHCGCLPEVLEEGGMVTEHHGVTRHCGAGFKAAGKLIGKVRVRETNASGEIEEAFSVQLFMGAGEQRASVGDGDGDAVVPVRAVEGRTGIGVIIGRDGVHPRALSVTRGSRGV
jgi:hypothetical protein